MTYYEGCIVSLSDNQMKKHLILGKFNSINDVFDQLFFHDVDLDFDEIENPYLAVAIFDEEKIKMDCSDHGCVPALKLKFFKLGKNNRIF